MRPGTRRTRGSNDLRPPRWTGDTSLHAAHPCNARPSGGGDICICGAQPARVSTPPQRGAQKWWEILRHTDTQPAGTLSTALPTLAAK